MIHVTDDEMNIILNIIEKYASNCDVLAFGSRYKGTHWKHSDLDLAFSGEKELGYLRIAELKDAFEESDLPYSVDVLDYKAVSPNFRAIIDKGNKIIYKNMM